MSALIDAYQEIPYESRACPQSHPGRMAVMASLFGLSPRPPESARVLEIGCAVGGNLLPMAAALPGSRFVGIDLSPHQIATARSEAAELGLGNAEFHACGIGELEGFLSSVFDYVIAHGVYSWVAAPVREQLMAACARLLAPEGVAFISYNTLPGSAARSDLRNMLRFHLPPSSGSLTERVRGARTFMRFLESSLDGRTDAYALAMREELSLVAGLGDFYLAHEHLEETNDPCYFHQFMEHAERLGLRFLAEADIQLMSTAGFPQKVRADLREMASSIVQAEQYGDFVRGRAFRQTLLCRAEAPVKHSISPDRVRAFHFSSLLEPAGTAAPESGVFRDPDGVEIKARDPLTHAALLELRAAWPGAMSFENLLAAASVRAGLPADHPQAAAVLTNSLLTCFSASRAVEFHYQALPIQTSIPDFPSTTPLIRRQAGRSSQVTSLRHENVKLHPAEAALLIALDGSRNLPALETEFPGARPMLERFVKAGLLIA